MTKKQHIIVIFLSQMLNYTQQKFHFIWGGGGGSGPLTGGEPPPLTLYPLRSVPALLMRKSDEMYYISG